MRNLLTLLAGALCVTTLTSCVESKHPLSDPAAAKQDASLYGVWVSKDASSITYTHIGADGITEEGKGSPPGMMRFANVNHQEAKGKPPSLESAGSGRFFVTQIGAERYANFYFPLDIDRKEEQLHAPAFMFARYQVEEDTLKIWLMDPDPIAKAIEKKLLPGTVERPAPGKAFALPKVTATANSEEWTAFLQTEAGKKSFLEEPLTYRRLRK